MTRRIIVSGGSRGLGLAFCRHYVDQGHKVLTFSRNPSEGIEELVANDHHRIQWLSRDLADPETPGNVARDAEQFLGGVDVLVNNAARPQDTLFLHQSESGIRDVFEVNLTATILLTKTIAKQMVLNGAGSILNVSSVSGSRAYRGLVVYGAAKAALEMFTRSLAVELGPMGIQVNAVAPGIFISDMTEVLSEDQIATIGRRTPTRRLSSTDEIVRACDILIDDATNITGQVLTIDGGATLA
jgi:3-oxoacyl-[acyl-carrier protein] reductase